jgi:hypothetical protein
MENAGDRLDTLPSSEIPYRAMEDIGNILHHFRKRCRLKHFDLHAGNVLLLGDVVKITDFDSASIRIGDTGFAVFQNDYATDDLFTLMTSLRYNSELFREAPLSKIAHIIDLFLLYDPMGKRINVYDVMQKYIDSYNAGKREEDKINFDELTSGIYYRQLPKYLWESDTHSRLLLDADNGILKNLQPDRFAQIWRAIRTNPEFADWIEALATGNNSSALMAWIGAHPEYLPLLKGGFHGRRRHQKTRKHKNKNKSKSKQSRKHRFR